GASVLSESHTLTRCTQLESVGSATGREPDYSNFQLADGEGFEPPRPLRAFRFSRPAPSTTRPPIRLVLPGLCASKDGVGHLVAQRRKRLAPPPPTVWRKNTLEGKAVCECVSGDLPGSSCPQRSQGSARQRARCLCIVRCDGIHQGRREAVIGFKPKLPQTRTDGWHAYRIRPGLDHRRDERRKLRRGPAFLPRKLRVNEVEPVERVIAVLDAPIHVHATLATGVPLNHG